jgi:hypothetical protein
LRDGHWLELTARATRLWRSRYRADATALVLGSTAELHLVVGWCLASGIERSQLGIIVPAEHPLQAIELTAVAGDDGALPYQVGALPKLRSQYRSQGQVRVGFQVIENDRGPLTHMTQFHRAMHVLSVWMQVRGESVTSAPTGARSSMGALSATHPTWPHATNMAATS